MLIIIIATSSLLHRINCIHLACCVGEMLFFQAQLLTPHCRKITMYACKLAKYIQDRSNSLSLKREETAGMHVEKGSIVGKGCAYASFDVIDHMNREHQLSVKKKKEFTRQCAWRWWEAASAGKLENRSMLVKGFTTCTAHMIWPHSTRFGSQFQYNCVNHPQLKWNHNTPFVVVWKLFHHSVCCITQRPQTECIFYCPISVFANKLYLKAAKAT